MGTIMPNDELLRRAVEWILSEKREEPNKTTFDLIEESGMRYNLSPAQSAKLQHLMIAMSKN